MDGPTWATTRPICSTWLSFGRRGSLWCVCTRMKILSTPTASTKNGITWNDFTNFSIRYLGNHYIGLKLLEKRRKRTGKHTNIQRWLLIEEIRVKMKFGNSFPGTVWMHKFRIYIKHSYSSTLTSMMIKVAGTPIKPNKPTEHPTEASTINTPPNPSVTLLSIWNRKTSNLSTISSYILQF